MLSEPLRFDLKVFWDNFDENQLAKDFFVTI